MKDWTAHEGVSNTSPIYQELVDTVDRIILDSAHSLIQGHSKTVARLIVSILAHKHKLSPPMRKRRR